MCMCVLETSKRSVHVCVANAMRASHTTVRASHTTVRASHAAVPASHTTTVRDSHAAVPATHTTVRDSHAAVRATHTTVRAIMLNALAEIRSCASHARHAQGGVETAHDVGQR